jgi:hypothetical protein
MAAGAGYGRRPDLAGHCESAKVFLQIALGLLTWLGPTCETPRRRDLLRPLDRSVT